MTSYSCTFLAIVIIEEEFCLQGSGFVEFGVFETGLHFLVASAALGEFVGIAESA